MSVQNRSRASRATLIPQILLTIILLLTAIIIGTWIVLFLFLSRKHETRRIFYTSDYHHFLVLDLQPLSRQLRSWKIEPALDQTSSTEEKEREERAERGEVVEKEEVGDFSAYQRVVQRTNLLPDEVIELSTDEFQIITTSNSLPSHIVRHKELAFFPAWMFDWYYRHQTKLTTEVLPRTVSPECTVGVLNGTEESGLASGFAALLERNGFQVLKIGDSPKTSETLLYYHPRVAESCQEWFGEFSLLFQVEWVENQELSERERADLVIVLGEKASLVLKQQSP